MPGRADVLAVGRFGGVALGGEMFWTPNTTNLRPRARGLVCVWEQFFAASWIQTCFQLRAVSVFAERYRSENGRGSAFTARGPIERGGHLFRASAWLQEFVTSCVMFW